MPGAHFISVTSNPVEQSPGPVSGAVAQPTSLSNTLTSYKERNSLYFPFDTGCVIIINRLGD